MTFQAPALGERFRALAAHPVPIQRRASGAAGFDVPAQIFEHIEKRFADTAEVSGRDRRGHTELLQWSSLVSLVVRYVVTVGEQAIRAIGTLIPTVLRWILLVGANSD
jgi:hypothetical protein